MGLTLANLLTIARMVMIPGFILAVLSGRNGYALLIFLIAGITDALDGLIARRWNQKTPLGAFLDPMADKLLLASAFVVLSLPSQLRLFPNLILKNPVPVELAVLVISRDVFIVLLALLLHLTTGRRQFPPTVLGKWATAVQTGTLGVVLLYNYLEWESWLLVPAFFYLTLAITLASGFHYIYHAARSSEGAPTGKDPS